MSTTPLTDANRLLLRAIETPPDTGLETPLDRVAAAIWTVASQEPCRPDPEHLRRLRLTLAELQAEASTERAAYIDRARRHLRAVQRSRAKPVRRT
jgi:hypothetical protein